MVDNPSDNTFKVSFTEGLTPPRETGQKTAYQDIPYREWVEAVNEYRKVKTYDNKSLLRYGTSVKKCAKRFGMSAETFKKYAKMFLGGEKMPDGFFCFDRDE